MPLYEYRCENCGRTFELIQKFSDPPAEHCPSCGEGPVRKLLSSPAIQFKGTGWYVTDYAKKDSGSGKKAESSPTDKKTETKTESGSADKGSSTDTSTSTKKKD